MAMACDDWAPADSSGDESVEASAAQSSETRGPRLSATKPVACAQNGKRVQAKAKAACGPKRTLKRRPTDAKPDQADARNMVCVWGGTVRHPVVVWPLFREGNQFCFQVSEHSHWLRRACDQKGLTYYKDWRIPPKLKFPAFSGIL